MSSKKLQRLHAKLDHRLWNAPCTAIDNDRFLDLWRSAALDQIDNYEYGSANNSIMSVVDERIQRVTELLHQAFEHVDTGHDWAE